MAFLSLDNKSGLGYKCAKYATKTHKGTTPTCDLDVGSMFSTHSFFFLCTVPCTILICHDNPAFSCRFISCTHIYRPLEKFKTHVTSQNCYLKLWRLTLNLWLPLQLVYLWTHSLTLIALPTKHWWLVSSDIKVDFSN